MRANQIVIYELESGEAVVDVLLEKETLWLSLNQLAVLFDRDKSVISRHLKNIFHEGELERDSVVAKYATTASDHKTYEVEHFNLDAILSVGYRVNSKRGTQFRRWASRILQTHLVKGYSFNEQRFSLQKIKELEGAFDLLSQTLVNQSLVNDVGVHVINIIHKYAKTWRTLLEYDEDRILVKSKQGAEELIELNPEEVLVSIAALKKELTNIGEASQLFGLERNDMLKGILGSLSQTFDQIPVYPTNVERASHLLYFIIKDHPFCDGNKRIACFLFLIFLSKTTINWTKMVNNSLIALALLVAESQPFQKDVMIKLITKLIEE